MLGEPSGAAGPRALRRGGSQLPSKGEVWEAGSTRGPTKYFWLGTSSSSGVASRASAQLGFRKRKLTHKNLNIYVIF